MKCFDEGIPFEDRVKELRKKAGKTQSELAKALNVSVSLIGMYESGRRMPSTEQLLAMSRYFDVDTNYLLGQNDSFSKMINEQQEINEEWIIRHPDELELLKKWRELDALPLDMRAFAKKSVNHLLGQFVGEIKNYANPDENR